MSRLEPSPATRCSDPVPCRTRPVGDEVLTDAELVLGAIELQDWAWTDLVRRYTNTVGAIARSYGLRNADVAEIRQIVWMRLFEHMDAIRQPERIAGWIGTVTRNECQKMLKNYRREIPSTSHATLDGPCDDSVDDAILERERSEAVRRGLVRLEGRGRALMETLLTQPDTSYESLAHELGMSIGSIGPTRQRCIRRLRASPELAGLASTA